MIKRILIIVTNVFLKNKYKSRSIIKNEKGRNNKIINKTKRSTFVDLFLYFKNKYFHKEQKNGKIKITLK
jgi:hypothetical protein